MFVTEGARRALVTDGLASYAEETLNPAVEVGLALGLDINSIANHVRVYGINLRTERDS